MPTGLRSCVRFRLVAYLLYSVLLVLSSPSHAGIGDFFNANANGSEGGLAAQVTPANGH